MFVRKRTMFKMMNLTLIVPIARCKWFAIKSSIKSLMLNLMFDAYYFCCHIGKITAETKNQKSNPNKPTKASLTHLYIRNDFPSI